MERFDLPDVNDPSLYESANYRACRDLVAGADNLILASPIYNWGICSELKKFIEVVGSTDASHPSPFFDKLISLVFAAGLPHSYMAFSTVAIPLMLDFRCIINPYQAYLHNRHWDETNSLTNEGLAKLELMVGAHINLGQRLKSYRMTKGWSV